MQPIAIVFNRGGANRFNFEKPTVSKVIALCPSAFHELSKVDHADDLMLSFDSFRTLQRRLLIQTRTERHFEKLADLNRHSRLCLTILKQSLSHLIGCFHRVKYVVGNNGPWLLYIDDECFSYNLQNDVIKKLFNCVVHDTDFFQFATRISPSRFSWFFHFLYLAALKYLVKFNESIIIYKRGRGMLPFVSSYLNISNSDRRYIDVSYSKNIFKSFLSLLFRPNGSYMSISVPLISGKSDNISSYITAVHSHTDPLYVEMLEITGISKLVCAYVAHIEELTRSLTTIFNYSKPECLVVWTLGNSIGQVLASAAETSDFRVVVVPATSISMGYISRTSIISSRRFSRYIIGDSPRFEYISQSPTSEEAILDLNAALHFNVIRHSAVNWSSKAAITGNNVNRSDTKFRLLLLGQYMSWHDDFHVSRLTSNEFYNSIRKLFDLCSQVSNIEITIRSKAKEEFDLPAFQSLTSNYENLVIHCSNDIQNDSLVPPLSVDVTNSHLVVGFSTTALEDAIAMRRPVLLWGGNNRYNHLKLEATPLSASTRRAVYSERDIEGNFHNLVSILKLHANTQLNDQEIKSYCWI
jgi:hypothetical protein